MIICEKNIAILCWSCNVTLHNMDDFRHALWKLMHRREQRLMLDLQGVMYMNSAAITWLMEACRQGVGHQRRIVAAGIQSSLEVILNLAGAGAAIQLFRYRSAAIDDLRSWSVREEWRAWDDGGQRFSRARLGSPQQS
ncbi:STAS domain-containing protein [Paenibacillus sp. J5C_2022]|uniref:STAS domain-containing protein n=1 Tax=Paenibacillus sp. J5C2022 TaxID=2977129 RepID=UPI0021D380B0|nr:STAS domain-containing protein [Paenibacillus sp. J5C2022]MCU6710629.1 STAS domain-containing protein [Paenibacillus sp. J5C2022]